jgi:SprT protein
LKQEAPLHALGHFLPTGTLDSVLAYIRFYKVHVTITRDRQSVLGDYRHPWQNKGHRISINGGLNTYAFLLTFLHEIAHLVTFEKYGNRVQAHGQEWKQSYSEILQSYIGKGLLPDDIEDALRSSLRNPAASSCADVQLMRVLKRYDARKPNHFLIEQLPESSLFKLKDGRVFRRGACIRKRYRCEEVGTQKVYLFSPVYEVEACAG